MANLGDIGSAVRTPAVYSNRNAFGLLAQTYGNTAAGADATPLSIIRLHHSLGPFVDVVRADASGNWGFYDLDDGTYYASEVGSTNVWEIIVAGTSATVTALSGVSPSTVAFGYVS